MTRSHARLPGLGLLAMIRHALSDLRFRPCKSLLSIVSVTVAVAYFLLLAYYGRSLYHYQRSLVERGLPHRVEARCTDVADASQRWTEARQQEIRARPGIVNVFPRIEVGVKVSLPAGSPISASAEGTVPGDEALTPQRFCLGRTVAGPDAREAVLSRRLFEKLGGTVEAGLPSPARLRLEVQRTTGGKTEVQTLVLQVVGLLEDGTEPRVYVPLRLAEQVDQWCAHQIEAMPGPGGPVSSPRLSGRTLRAYGPAEQQARVAGEVKDLQVEVRTLGSFTAIEPPGDVWLRIDGPVSAAKLRDAVGGTPSVLHPIWLRTGIIGGRPVSLVALSLEDPRWAGKPPPLGTVMTATDQTGPLYLGDAPLTITRAAHVPGFAEFACTSETLGLLELDQEHVQGVRFCTRISTSDRDLALFRGAWNAEDDWDFEEDPMGKTYTWLAWGTPEQARRALGEEAKRCSFTKLRALEVTEQIGNRKRRIWCLAPCQTARPEPIALPQRDSVRLSMDGTAWIETFLTHDKSLPAGAILVDAGTFRLLAGQQARRAGKLSIPEANAWTVRSVDVYCPRLLQKLRAAGFKVQPLTPAVEQSLVSYEVRLHDNDPRDPADVAAALALSRPTFTSALPHLQVEVEAGSSRFALEASLAADPRRFEVALLHGRWLASEQRRPELMLPAAVVKRLFPVTPLAECIGREVEIRCLRDRGVSDSDTALALRCRLVGVVDGPTGFALADWLQGLALWRQGKVLYNESSATFETPVQVYQRSGFLRCNIDLVNASSTRELVSWLEANGYQVEHRLAQQEGLRKLARVLVCLVLLFVVGFSTCAFMTVLISNALHLASKTYEIGILRAHGLSSGQIVGLFVLQGLASGLAAFVLAAVLVAITEPLLSKLVHVTFHLPESALPVPLAHSAHGGLFLLALVLAMLATTLGAMLPAWRACLLSPVQAMQRQD